MAQRVVRGSGRRGPQVAALATAMALAACSATTYDAVDPVVQVVTPVVWRGTTALLTCDALIGRDTLPVVIIGTDTVALTFVAPDTLRVTTPDSQGTYVVWLALHHRAPIPVGSVRVAGGYSGQIRVPAAGYPLAWPGGGLATFLMAQESGLAKVDPRAGSLAPFLPDSIFDQYCVNGPGPAPGGRITVSRRTLGVCGPLVAIRPDAPQSAPDTGPRGASPRFAAELARGLWLLFYENVVQVRSRDSLGGWSGPEYKMHSSYAFTVSPRGDRAVGLTWDMDGRGIPVFRTDSPEPAYWLAQFVQLWGAQFSDDGDTLFVVGLPRGSAPGAAPVLAALSASDGTVFRSAPSWYPTEFLILDPGRPWLYLVGGTNRSPAVQVVDRTTFATVTTLVGPYTGFTVDTYPFLSVADRRLYLVDTCPFCVHHGTTGGPAVWAFDLIP